MNTTVNALKNLYEAAGGQETTVENVNLIPDMIDALADIATPFIKSTDEGKVVQNGALVAQTSKNISTNGTHDTTANNSVLVNVKPLIETVTGTVANPWGDHSYSDLVAGISNKTLIVKIESDSLNAFGVVVGGKIQFSRAYLYPGLEYASDLDGCSYLYRNTGVLEYAAIAQGNETVEAVAPTTATTLTIIHVDYSTT